MPEQNFFILSGSNKLCFGPKTSCSINIFKDKLCFAGLNFTFEKQIILLSFHLSESFHFNVAYIFHHLKR